MNTDCRQYTAVVLYVFWTVRPQLTLPQHSYEPLHKWGVKVMTGDNEETRSSLVYLDNLFHCHLQHYEHILTYQDMQEWYRRANQRLYDNLTCVGPSGACTNPEYVSTRCRNSTVHVAKVNIFNCAGRKSCYIPKKVVAICVE